MMKTKVIDVQINKKHAEKYKKGYPLIQLDALLNKQTQLNEGDIMDLYDGTSFVCKAYHGKQNKGYGWVLSDDIAVSIDASFFIEKLQEAMMRRKKYKDSIDTTAYRIFNGEGDGIGGLTIDYLDGHYLVTWYNLGIYAYKDIIMKALKKLTAYKSIYEKRRFDSGGKYNMGEDFVDGDVPEFPIIVLENDIRFAVYLDDGPMIGFFLDQKDVRKRLMDFYCKDKHVLNTFSYTGAFSISAALGGAKETVSVDVANRSKSRTIEHFELNDIVVSAQKVIVEDVFEYFKYAVRKKLKFDVVILDPPSFARTKKRTFSVAKDYVKLLEQAIEITAEEGLIVASTNYSKGDMKWFKGCVDKAFKTGNNDYKIVESFVLPDDFNYKNTFIEGNYLKVLFVRKK